MNLNAAIIVSDNSVSKWENDALGEVSDILNVKLILNCENNNRNRKILKYFAYYCLNAITLKNRLTAKKCTKI